MTEPLTLPEAAPMAEYQRYIERLEAMHGWDSVDLVHNCFLMSEEVGELFKAVRRLLKVFPEGGGVAPADPRGEVADELVDVFNYLLAIANRAGVDLEAAFRKKNALNQLRTWG